MTRDQTHVPCIGTWILNHWTTREAQGWVSLSVSCSVVSDSATPWTVAHQAPLSMGFPRQEYWSGLLCPPPGHLPYPRTEPQSPASPALAVGFFTTSPLGKPQYNCSVCVCVCVLVAQSCLTLCDPIDCSLPGSSVHRILQARILGWVAIWISHFFLEAPLCLRSTSSHFSRLQPSPSFFF